jgi:hypothetical protein
MNKQTVNRFHIERFYLKKFNENACGNSLYFGTDHSYPTCIQIQGSPHLRLFWEAVDLNTELRKTLN